LLKFVDKGLNVLRIRAVAVQVPVQLKRQNFRFGEGIASAIGHNLVPSVTIVQQSD
jgi:hypothetical protein